jgi:hypothetical protein
MDPNAGGAPGGAGGPPGGGAGGPPGGFQGPPDPNFIPAPPTELAKSIAFGLAGAGITLNVISFIVFSLRVYARTVPTIRLNWDDYTISLAFVSLLSTVFTYLD